MIFRKAEKKLSMSWCCELWERKEHIRKLLMATLTKDEKNGEKQ